MLTVTSIHILGAHVNRCYRTTQCVSAVFAVSPGVCLSVRPSVCHVGVGYCIHTAEDIVKLFSRPGSRITLVFLPPAPAPNSNLPICDFRLTSPFISEMVRDIGPWLLWNVNRKLRAADRSASVPMTLSDPNPGFKVTAYLQVNYLRDRVTIEH